MHERDIYVLIRDEGMDDDAIEQEVKHIDRMLSRLEKNQELFYKVNELVQRTSITRKRIKLLQVMGKRNLKPFQFLINKN